MNGWQLALRREDELNLVCHKHGITLDMLKGKRRTKPIALARHEAMYRLRQLGMSYPRIGTILGGRDHSTVIHGVRMHAQRNGLEAL